MDTGAGDRKAFVGEGAGAGRDGNMFGISEFSANIRAKFLCK